MKCPMRIENDRDLRGMRRIGQICGQALQHMLANAEPGMTTRQLDDIGRAFLTKQGAQSAPITAYKFPGWTCISLNDVVAHGVPGDTVIQPGDLINVDVSAVLEGYWGDTGASRPMPPASGAHERLCATTRRALAAGIAAAKEGAPINAIGNAVQTIATEGGYSLIRELGGHGVGRHIHEKPSVPNYYSRRLTQPLEGGLVFTIEPFLNTGRGRIYTDARDGWSLRTVDHTVAAQYEHTIVIDGAHPIVLTEPGA
jgi:methionyl aminopeptidase